MLTLLSGIKGFIAGFGSRAVELMCWFNSKRLKVRCSLKILQDITKLQVTNRSLPGDSESTLQQPSSAEPEQHWDRTRLFITQRGQLSPFPFSHSVDLRCGRNTTASPSSMHTGDQFAQPVLVWITLSIRSHCVYRHIHYSSGHGAEVCLSGDNREEINGQRVRHSWTGIWTNLNGQL